MACGSEAGGDENNKPIDQWKHLMQRRLDFEPRTLSPKWWMEMLLPFVRNA